MADDRDSLLREVDEELRREQMQKIWDQYSLLILGAAAAIVVGVGGFKFWQNQRLAAAEANGAKFEQALRLEADKKAEDAAKAFEAIAAQGSRGYGGLARLHLAGAQAKAGRTAEAVATYEALANDASSDRLIRDFAALQAASLRLPDADFTEMQNRLKTMTVEGEPFRTSASELLGLSAFKAGKYEDARNLLEPLLIDPRAARPIQDRLKIVLAEIASAEIAKAPAAAAPDAAKPAEASPPEKK